MAAWLRNLCNSAAGASPDASSVRPPDSRYNDYPIGLFRITKRLNNFLTSAQAASLIVRGSPKPPVEIPQRIIID